MVKSAAAPLAGSPARPTAPRIARAVARTGSSAIRDLLEITERPEIISLAGGLPTPDAFPVADLARATAEVLADDPHAALQYGASEGFRPLRAWVADRYRVGGETGHEAGVAGVTITHGSQQALELLARATTDPGEAIALADPGYVGAIQAFRSAGAELVGIASDRHGLCVNDLERRLAAGLRPTLVYVVATFDNPTGATLPLDRRLALAELADRYGFWIVDDDPYGTLRWAGPAVTPLRELSDRVISVGTTSKMLCPGLRVGWAVSPPELARALVVLKQAADLHTGSLSQHVVHRLVARPDGWLDAHLEVVRARYRAQSDVLVAELHAQLGDRLAFRSPEGGMFLWATLADGAGGAVGDTSALLERALAHGVAFVPGRAFGVSAGHPRSLRLSFATTDAAGLAEGVRRLGLALDRSGR